jgi:hypothetical protein
MLLVTGLLAFLGVTFVIVSHDIHLAPNKLAFQKDAAALERLESQSRQDNSRIESRSLLSATASSAGLDRVDAQSEEILQSAPRKASLIARLPGSVDRKRSIDSGAARKPLTGFKRDLEVPLDNIGNPQRQRAISPPRQRYEQRGLSSLFAGIGHALGFSRH